MKQLPVESISTKRNCNSENFDNENFEKEWGEIYKNDPEKRIIALVETLCKFIALKENKKDKVIEVIDAIKRNIQKITSNEMEQKILLTKYLNHLSSYYNKTPLMLAADSAKASTQELLITEMSGFSFTDTRNEIKDLIKKLLKEIDLQDSSFLTIKEILSSFEKNIEMLKLSQQDKKFLLSI